MHPFTRAAAAALLTLAFAPAAADAGSISFLRGGNVWVAAEDGTRQTQLTTDGGYAYQSRADDGSLIAVRGRLLRRLAPDGKLLAEFTTPVSGEPAAPNSSFFRGPFQAEISPDGSKVAYDYWHQEVFNEPGCFPVGDPRCQAKRVSVGIGYTHADRLTGWDEPGLGRQSGWLHPSWVGNDTLLMSGKSVLPNVDAIIDHPGDGNQTIARWFEDTGAWHVKDGEVSRRGDAAAFLSTTPRHASDPHWGQEDDQITIYRMTGAAPALPEQCFSFQNKDAIYASPSFAPDGGAVAWESDERGGEAQPPQIVVGQIPSQAGGCQLPTDGGKTLIENGAQPDWSPAPVPTIAAPPANAPGPSGGSGAATPDPAVGGGASAALAPALRSTKLGKVLSRGLGVQVTAPAAGRLSVTVLRGKRTLASGKASVRRAGKQLVTARFTAAAKRSLRAAPKVTVIVRVRFTPHGGTAITHERKLTLRR